ncbi:MAG: CBS domain-containing protein [Deltaproteobacteria bacterium]|nr:CBS domain-containing protein [Deltaproteobacteria bacterium]
MEEKRVKEVMLSIDEYASVSSEATIREALLQLHKAQLELLPERHHYRAVLVFDQAGNVIGKLTQWAILRSLEPTFFTNSDCETVARSGLSQEFIKSLQKSFSLFRGNLSQMCAEAAKIKVKDAMVPARESVDEETPLTEAIHQMVLGHWQSILVTREGKVSGIVRLSDVFEEVANLIIRDSSD